MRESFIFLSVDFLKAKDIGIKPEKLRAHHKRCVLLTSDAGSVYHQNFPG
jgi:hypothetical protein